MESTPTLSSFPQKAARNSLFLIGFQGMGKLLGSSPAAGYISTYQIHISVWPCARYKFDMYLWTGCFAFIQFSEVILCQTARLISLKARYESLVESLIHSVYFYSTFLSPLLLRGAPNYSIHTVSELTCRIATGNFYTYLHMKPFWFQGVFVLLLSSQSSNHMS